MTNVNDMIASSNTVLNKAIEMGKRAHETPVPRGAIFDQRLFDFMGAGLGHGVRYTLLIGGKNIYTKPINIAEPINHVGITC